MGIYLQRPHRLARYRGSFGQTHLPELHGLERLPLPRWQPLQQRLDLRRRSRCINIDIRFGVGKGFIALGARR